VTEKYEFIDAEYAAAAAADAACAPTITQMCSWLSVSRSGFYDWSPVPNRQRQGGGPNSNC
jgi:putative transposase